jgi:ribosomal protein L31
MSLAIYCTWKVHWNVIINLHEKYWECYSTYIMYEKYTGNINQPTWKVHWEYQPTYKCTWKLHWEYQPTYMKRTLGISSRSTYMKSTLGISTNLHETYTGDINQPTWKRISSNLHEMYTGNINQPTWNIHWGYHPTYMKGTLGMPSTYMKCTYVHEKYTVNVIINLHEKYTGNINQPTGNINQTYMKSTLGNIIITVRAVLKKWGSQKPSFFMVFLFTHSENHVFSWFSSLDNVIFSKLSSWTPKGYNRPPVGLGSLRSWINQANSVPLCTRKEVANHSPWTPQSKQTSSKDIWSWDFHCTPILDSSQIKTKNNLFKDLTVLFVWNVLWRSGCSLWWTHSIVWEVV